MYTARLSIQDSIGDGQAQIVGDTGSYATSAEAEAELRAWRLRLMEASCNGTLAIRKDPGWLTMELVDYTNTSESDMPNGWVMDVDRVWQRFASDPHMHGLLGNSYWDSMGIDVPPSHKQVCPYH